MKVAFKLVIWLLSRSTSKHKGLTKLPNNKTSKQKYLIALLEESIDLFIFRSGFFIRSKIFG